MQRPDLTQGRSLSRRVFLRVLGWAWALPAGIGLWQVARFLGYRPPAPDPTVVALGLPEGLPLLPAAIERARIYLQQDEAGYFALDMVCTHLGCMVRPQAAGGFACRCHGSRFTSDGQVVTGPAVKALPSLELRWDSIGQLVVDRSRKVSSTFRLPPRG
jgi:nitrite reductase/ring-hydroxylating ferredoxin subunit